MKTSRIDALRAGIAVLALTALGLAFGTGGCGGRDTLPVEQRKLLVFGMDSADWRLLDPMIAEGRLPNLAAFRNASCSGRMETLVPLTKSPILWASISTGLPPEAHGIGGFVKGAGQEPVTGADWRAPAIWDIAGAAGLSSDVIGMWTTYPARDIDGVIISDFLTYGHGAGVSPAGLVSPADLTDDILAVRVDPDSIPLSELERFIPADRLDAAERDYPVLMKKLRQIYASDLTYLNSARLLAERFDHDLFYFYQRGPDMISHTFWAFFEPEKCTHKPSDEEIAIFGQVVPRYYDVSDEILGEVLGWFPPDMQAVIVSDHGFWGPRKSGQKGVHEHSKWGIFLVRSPLYEAGTTFDAIPLYDICPTLMAMLNLPPSDDMPGVILQDGLTGLGTRVAARLEDGRIGSYQSLSPAQAGGDEVAPEVSEEIRRQLESLGYID